jgi:hypothetical protein
MIKTDSIPYILIYYHVYNQRYWKKKTKTIPCGSRSGLTVRPVTLRCDLLWSGSAQQERARGSVEIVSKGGRRQ